MAGVRPARVFIRSHAGRCISGPRLRVPDDVKIKPVLQAEEGAARQSERQKAGKSRGLSADGYDDSEW